MGIKNDLLKKIRIFFVVRKQHLKNQTRKKNIGKIVGYFLIECIEV